MSGAIAQRFTLGDLTITALCLGEISDDVASWFTETPPNISHQLSHLPVICLHVSGLEVSVLIDACDPQLYSVSGLDSLTIAAALTSAGISPDSLSHVILTHGHHDHFSGVWEKNSDKPSFPNARHVLSSEDWEKSTLTQEAQMADGGAADSKPLEKLFRLGLLDFDTPNTPLASSITLIEAPGETEGHRVVRLTSYGQTFYFLADLFHVPTELDDPTFCPIWADAPKLIESRRRLATEIKHCNARFMCSHMTEVFTSERLNQTSTALKPL